MKILSEIIKKILYNFLKLSWRTAELAVIVLILLVFLFRSHSFQTFLAAKVTSYYSIVLETDFQIDRVKINGFEYIELHNLFIADLAGDTILHAPVVKGTLKDFSFENKFAVFDFVNVENTRIKIQQNKAVSELNLQFLVDYFNRDSSTGSEFTVKIEKIGLQNTHFSYHNWNESKMEYGIDYAHLEVKNLNGNILELRNRNGITAVDLADISFNESSGFNVKELNGHFVYHPNKIKLEKFSIQTSKSSIKSKGIAFNYRDLGDLKDFVHAVHMEGALLPSYLDFKDLSYFVPSLKSIDRTINISGEVNGTANDLNINNLKLAVSDISSFEGDVNFKGLSDLENCLILVNIKNCQTSKIDLETIRLDKFGFGKKLSLPVELERLGVVKLEGVVDGFYDDFSTNFDISSDNGDISGDFRCSINNKQFVYSGTLSTANFNAGYVLDNENLGMFSSDFKVVGKGVKLKEMEVELNGEFTDFNVMGYGYDNISVKGDLSDNSFDGELTILDDNIDLFFTGEFDLSQNPIQFDFNVDVQKAHLYELNVIDSRESSSLCFNLFASGFGNTFDDFSGMVEVRNIGYYEEGRDYYFDSILFDSQSNAYSHNLELYSKFAEFKMGGSFDFDTLAVNLYQLGSKVFPSILPQKNESFVAHDDFLMDLKINDLTKLTELFFPKLSVSKDSKVKCSFNSDDEMLELYTTSDWIEYNGIRFSSIELDTSTTLELSDSSYNIEFSIDSIILSDKFFLQNINLSSSAYNDSIDFDLTWKDDDSTYSGQLLGGMRIHGPDEFEVQFLPSSIRSEKAGYWSFGDSMFLKVDSSSIEFHDVVISNENQMALLDGKISENPLDLLNFNIQNIELNDFEKLVSVDELGFSGLLNSKGNISDLYGAVYFDAVTTVDSLIVNNLLLGDFFSESKWNPKENRIELIGGLLESNGEDSRGINVKESYYYPLKMDSSLNVRFELNDFNIGFIDPFLPKDVLSNFSGKLDGELNLEGTFTVPELNGTLALKESSINLDILNTMYLAEGEINVLPDMVEFNGIKVEDKFGTQGIAVGSFYHHNFSRYSYDLLASFNQPFIAMNTSYKMNPLYYGDAFITGDVMMEYDSINLLRINVDAKTEKGTNLTLPLYGSEDVVLQDFISFEGTENQEGNYEVSLEGITMNLGIDLTEDAQFQLVFDEIVGDAMIGNGKGHLDMVIDQFNDFSMFGQFNVSQGSYLFTLKDFINKKFKLQSGGSISWYGDPYNAELDLITYYPLKTSLYDIMPANEKEDWKQKKDINVLMHLTENLFNPEIDFDIEIPRGTESAKTAIRSLVSSEQEMNQQVFSLLILNKFMTDRPEISNATLDLSLSTTSEMLSSQLSNMISKFSDDFDIGFNYSPGDNISNDEVSVAMSTQQFNNRLTFETNLGVSQGNSLNKNPSSFIGDVDVEYKLNSEGNLRVHAFNQSNAYDFTNIEQSAYTQGLGVFYKQSFNNFGELFCELGNLFKAKSKECQSCQNKEGRRQCKEVSK